MSEPQMVFQTKADGGHRIVGHTTGRAIGHHKWFIKLGGNCSVKL